MILFFLGVGSGRPDPEIRGGGGVAVSKQIFFRPFGPKFGLKIRRAHPLESPRVRYYIIISVAATTGITTSGALDSGY